MATGFPSGPPVTGNRLRGVGVLVTRPRPQSAVLCELLEAEGAVATPFPAIDIEPARDLHQLHTRLASGQPVDLMIFTSANAVHFGAGLLERQPHAAIAAIGPATIRALGESARRVAFGPLGSVDSEGLLRNPEFAEMTGKRVALITGARGRELLAQELNRRGARVEVLEVYRRERAAPDPRTLAAVRARLDAGEIHIITATSAEVAESLLAILPALTGDAARRHWLVPGARVAASVRELGVRAPIMQARSALDHDLVDAIVRWRAREP